MATIVIFLAGCGASSKPAARFDPGARAYYIDKKDYDRPKRQALQLSISASEIIRLLGDVFKDQFNSNSNVVRIEEQPGDRNLMAARAIFKVITPPIKPANKDEFNRYFKIGEYILDRPGMKVEAERFLFSVDAVVSLEGQMLSIEFVLNPYVEWNLYKQDKNGEWQRVSEDLKPYYGVSTYRFQKEVVETDNKGKEHRRLVWEEIPVSDRPNSYGQLEMELINKTLELAAIRGYSALIVDVR